LASLYKKPYFDSSLFISFIKNEIVDDINRGEIVADILRDVEANRSNIYTSTATIAEVHKKKNCSGLTLAEDNSILEFFEHEFIKLIDVDRNVGVKANLLCNEYSLSPFDGIHVACALIAGCDTLLTWDENLKTCAESIIRIEFPSYIGQRMLDLQNII